MSGRKRFLSIFPIIASGMAAMLVILRGADYGGRRITLTAKDVHESGSDTGVELHGAPVSRAQAAARWQPAATPTKEDLAKDNKLFLTLAGQCTTGLRRYQDRRRGRSSVFGSSAKYQAALEMRPDLHEFFRSGNIVLDERPKKAEPDVSRSGNLVAWIRRRKSVSSDSGTFT